MNVHGPAKLELAIVAETGDLLTFGFRFGQSREQQARQNRDDRDDDEEFDEGKRPRPLAEGFRSA